MEIKVLGCSGGRSPGLELTSFLIDGNILLDTGAASASLTLEEQEALGEILLTHPHLDHIIGLGFIYQNTVHSRVRPLQVYGTEPVLSRVREYFLRPDIIEGIDPDLPGIDFHPVAFEVPFHVGTHEIEALPADHTPGSVGYRVSDGIHDFVFSGDTGPEGGFWEWLGRAEPPHCLVAEVSFPNQMSELATMSKHLTPAMLVSCLDRSGILPEQRVHISHLKPAFMSELFDQIESQREWNHVILRKGDLIRLDKDAPLTEDLQRQVERKVADKIPEFDRGEDLHAQRDRLDREFGVNFKKGQLIFQHGDNSRVMYIVREGLVRILRRADGDEQTLAEIGPGDFFGEMAMLNSRPRSASARAVTDVKLLAFDKPAFEKLLLENFGVALRIIRTLTQRLQDADLLIENLIFPDAESKVVNTLIHAAYDEGIETGKGCLLRITPEKLSDKSGVVISTLREIFENLIHRGLVVPGRESVVVPDLTRLGRFLKYIELRDEFD